LFVGTGTGTGWVIAADDPVTADDPVDNGMVVVDGVFAKIALDLFTRNMSS
jgi:hypothetical protein